MNTMDYGHEIERLEAEIAATDRAVDASAALREKRDRLKAAQEAEEEARRREAETRAAARAVREAEADARRAEAEPLRTELTTLDQPLAEIEAEVTQYLQAGVADARRIYDRYVAALARRNAVAAKLGALGERAPHVQVLPFEAFVLVALRRFDTTGRTASGAGWARDK